MKTQELIETLSSHQDKRLVFEYAPGQRVAPGYHVTEVMNVIYESMDCGGKPNFWRETVAQLMDPSPLDTPEFMTVRKFLSIYSRVTASVPVHPEAEIRFEYGSPSLPAVRYEVGELALEGDHLVVRLTPPGVTCKGIQAETGCCAPLELSMATPTAKRCC